MIVFIKIINLENLKTPLCYEYDCGQYVSNRVFEFIFGGDRTTKRRFVAMSTQLQIGLRSSMVLFRISFEIFFWFITSLEISLTQFVHRSISTSRAFKNGEFSTYIEEDEVEFSLLPISISSGFESLYDASRCWMIDTTCPSLSDAN